jgi:hypothetical protein
MTIVSMGGNVRHRINMNHANKALSRFWDKLSALDKAFAHELKG